MAKTKETEFEVEKKGHYLSIKVGGYGRLKIYSNPSNCKLSTIDSLHGALSRDKEKTFEAIARYSSLVFFVHVKCMSDIKTLQERFDLIYINEVPIGYGSGYQYHALFKRASKCTYDKRLKPLIEKHKEKDDKE